MSENRAIQVENATKVYKLYDSPQDRLKEALNPFRKKYHRAFFAIDGISFEIAKGESVGIVGQNGAGKSTLLKMITGVLCPTAGTVKVNGRISALLELGAGFNPQMTGLENIFFNGTIMGLAREEMEAKLDDIISFADIGDFINQPVKIYSSGMFVRLAFAVAVNVDPDILIVDEALSVGDVKFKQKCLRKIESFRDQGKTILMVTHDMGGIKTFCNTAMWLRDGKLFRHGDAKTIAGDYMNFMAYDMVPENHAGKPVESAQPDAVAPIIWDDVAECRHIGEGGAQIRKVALYRKNPLQKVALLEGGEELVFYVDIVANDCILQAIVSADIKDQHGILIFGVNSWFLEKEIPRLNENDTVTVEFSFTLPLLKQGDYTITTAISDGTYSSYVQHHVVHEACAFQVANRKLLSTKHYCITVNEADINVSHVPA